MTIRRIIETIFMPLKAISKLIDFISGIMPYPISAVKEIKTVLKSLAYGAMSVWRPFFHIVNICFEVVDETIKQVAITLWSERSITDKMKKETIETLQDAGTFVDHIANFVKNIVMGFGYVMRAVGNMISTAKPASAPMKVASRVGEYSAASTATFIPSITRFGTVISGGIASVSSAFGPIGATIGRAIAYITVLVTRVVIAITDFIVAVILPLVISLVSAAVSVAAATASTAAAAVPVAGAAVAAAPAAAA